MYWGEEKLDTGKTQNITITASSGLSDDEIEQMRREAEQHADEDRTNKEQIETRNNADTLAYSADKTLRDLGDKVPSDIKTEVEAKVAEIKTEMEKDTIDTARLKELTDSLSMSLQKVGEAAYQASDDAGQGMPATASDAEGEEGGDERFTLNWATPFSGTLTMSAESTIPGTCVGQ